MSFLSQALSHAPQIVAEVVAHNLPAIEPLLILTLVENAPREHDALVRAFTVPESAVQRIAGDLGVPADAVEAIVREHAEGEAKTILALQALKFGTPAPATPAAVVNP